jgi:Uma2 family endonuclease
MTFLTAPSRPFTQEDLRLLALPGGGHQVEVIDGALYITGEGFTREHRDSLPEDGRRHELIDGVIVVTPSPNRRHQSVLANLFDRLRRGCPAHLEVLFAPLDIYLPDGSIVEPDLVVLPRRPATEEDVRDLPVLVVEVLSPSTRRLDLAMKKDRYLVAGVPAYWVVDPDGPSVTVWELVDGAYEQLAQVAGDHLFTADLPFPVSFLPADLLD